MMSSSPLSYKVGFMFPGQGAQTVGMGAALANDIPAAKALYDTASGILGMFLIRLTCHILPRLISYLYHVQAMIF